MAGRYLFALQHNHVQTRNTLRHSCEFRGTLTPCRQTPPRHSSLFYGEKDSLTTSGVIYLLTFFHWCLIASKHMTRCGFGCGATYFAPD